MPGKMTLAILLIFLVSCQFQKPTGNEQRYVITSPEVAEIVCMLEGADNIVGITAECDFPAYLKEKEVVGNFGKVDYEKILKLKPSVVFTAGLEQDALSAELTKLGILVEQIHSRSIEEMLSSIERIGKMIGQLERSRFVTDSLKQEMLNIPEFDHSPLVYVEIYADPIMSVSRDSYLGELVNLAGGRNIFQELPRDYSRIDPEKVIAANPAIIILTHPVTTKKEVSQRKGWQVIPAVKNQRIYNDQDVDPDLILRASPRFILGVHKLQRVLYETD